jgi:hypothetical protein
MLDFKSILLFFTFLKNFTLLSIVMSNNRTIMAALFTIAIASSLVAVSGFVGSAYAAKREVNSGTVPTLSLDKEDKKKDNQSDLPAVLRPESKSDPQKTPSADAGDSSGPREDTSGVSAKALKSLSKCQSRAAADGDLTLAEVKDCYNQGF